MPTARTDTSEYRGYQITVTEWCGTWQPRLWPLEPHRRRRKSHTSLRTEGFTTALKNVDGGCDGAKDQVFGRKSQVSGFGDGYVFNVIVAINATRRDTFPESPFVPGVAPLNDP